MKKIFKENKRTIITFVISFIIINIVFFINDITPYGNLTTLKIDFYHQYGPMLKEVWYRITHFKNLLYSYNMSMGLPIYRNFFNYLASPFNIILLLFNEKTIITGYSFIIMLRVSICASIFNYYLEHKFNDKNNIYIFLSLLYAFSNYFVSYYWNIMWLDGMVFLPLIVLGIENIINKNKYLLYIISLTITLISNYYIGYACCIYSVIYFIGYLLYKTKFKSLKDKKYRKETYKKIIIYTLSSLSTGFLIAFFALPLLKSLSSISATTDAWPTSQYYSFNVIEFIINHLSCIETVTFKSDITNAPNISCGIISLALLLLFILNNKIKLKTKITYLSILSILILAFFIPQFDFIMHALHVPNDLPYRYSFLYSFTLIIICTYSLKNIKDIKPYKIMITYVLINILLFILKVLDLEILDNNTLLINLIIITIYFILYLVYYYDKKTIKYLNLALILISSVEIICNINFNWVITNNINDSYYYYDEIKDTKNKLDKLENNNFYRMEKTFSTTLNDSSWYNYNGITTFSSMEYESLTKLQYNLGLSSNIINSYEYLLNTPIYNIMFNLKYILGYNYDKDNYTKIYDNDLFTTYKFNYETNLLYALNKDINNYVIKDSDPIQNQNNFIYLSTGINNVFNKQKIKNKKTLESNNGILLIEYTFKNNYKNNYFYNTYNDEYYIINDTLYYKDDYILDYIDQKYYTELNQMDENTLINFINENKEYKILIGTYDLDREIEVYSINEKELKNATDIINKDKINIETFKETYIKANINTDKDKTIYTSIPYDNEIKVYIDGKKIKTNKFADSLLMFDIDSGNHIIEIKYENNLMIIGTIISSITLVIIIIIINKKH